LKRIGKILSVMLILALLILYGPSSISIKASGYTEPIEGLTINKIASVFKATNDGREIFKIDITAETESNIITIPKPCDIVLILDNSSSLNGNLDVPQGSPKLTVQEGVKQAAKDFIANVALNSPDSKIAVVNSKPALEDTTSTGLRDVPEEQAALNNAVDNLTITGAVHIENGLQKAKDIFSGMTYDQERYRFVIIVQGNSNWGNTEVEIDNLASELKGATDAGHCIIYAIGVYDKFNSMDQSMWEVSSNTEYGITPLNYLPNNPINGKENFYKTAYSADSLKAIFDGIAEETGNTLENVVIKDYIDSRFNAVDAYGNILGAGSEIIVDGVTGTIKQDSNGIYVEWVKDKIEPGTIENGKGFKGSFYIKPKDDFIGGNVIPTNIENISALYTDGQNIASLPNPTVNVPFKLNVADIADEIFLGEAVLKSPEQAQNSMLAPNPLYGYPGGLLSYIWDPAFTADTKPTIDTGFELTVKASPINYIDFSDTGWSEIEVDKVYKKSTGEIYYAPVGTAANLISDTGTYSITVKTGKLAINKSIIGNADANQTFVFEIKQYDDINKSNLIKTFYETIRVADDTNARTIINLPKGYYEVTELKDWSWQYNLTSNITVGDTLGMDVNGTRNINKTEASASFANVSKTINYLDSIDWVLNEFAGGE